MTTITRNLKSYFYDFVMLLYYEGLDCVKDVAQDLNTIEPIIKEAKPFLPEFQIYLIKGKDKNKVEKYMIALTSDGLDPNCHFYIKGSIPVIFIPYADVEEGINKQINELQAEGIKIKYKGMLDKIPEKAHFCETVMFFEEAQRRDELRRNWGMDGRRPSETINELDSMLGSEGSIE